MLEFFENNFMADSVGCSLCADPNIMDLFQENTSWFWPWFMNHLQALQHCATSS